VPADLVSPEPLAIPPCEGDAAAALAAFRDAHEKQKRGDVDGALAGYLAFSGMPGRNALPARYRTMVAERLEKLLADVRRRFDAAVERYGKDRQAGLADLRSIEERFPDLPEGQAARAFVQSDGLRAAIDGARVAAAAGRKEEAAKSLEQAVRAFPAGLYRYEAKQLLVDLGGPDLFEPGERIGGAEEPEDGKTTPEKKEGTKIEVSDD